MRRFREIDPKLEPEPPKPFSELRWIALTVVALVALLWFRDAAKRWDIERKKEQDLMTLREVNVVIPRGEDSPPDFNVPVPREQVPTFDQWTYEQEMLEARRNSDSATSPEIQVKLPPIDGLSGEEALKKVEFAEQ